MRMATLFDNRGKIFAGIIIGAIAGGLVIILSLAGLLESFELKAYDGLCRLPLVRLAAPEDVVIVAVDQGSLDAARQADVTWPWPRQMYAPIVEFATRAGARAIAFDILYTEPSSYGVEDDRLLAEAMRGSGRVILPLFLTGETRPPAAGEAGILAVTSLPVAGDAVCRSSRTGSILAPIEVLVPAARGFGNVRISPDRDGIYRRIPVAFCYRTHWLPSLGLAAWRYGTGDGAVAREQAGIRLGGRRIPLDRNGKFLLTYYDPAHEFPRYSAFNVISSALALQEGQTPVYDPAVFKDKIVFVGFTAPGLFDLKATPVSSIYPGVSIHATLAANLLRGDFRVRISRTAVVALTAAAAVLTGIAVMFAGGFGHLLLTALLAGGGLLALIFAAFRLHLWIDAVMVFAATGFAFTLTAAFSYATEGRQKRQIKQTFSHYMSDLLIQDILRNPDKLRLGGEKRVLTVFFSDLAGFTSLSEKLSAEEVVRLLNRYLTAMTDIILDSGGIIDKYEGDAIMAFWGAPVPQEDHARRACLAALDNQRRLVALRAEFVAEGLPPIRARIGLNTGEMIIGNLGSSKRFDFTVIGDSVNLASRLEGAGKEYGTSITISEETYRRVADDVEVRELDLLAVKGKEMPVRIYELLARKGELDDNRREVLRVFAEGLHHYRQMHWEEAIACFRKALDRDPDDGPSQTFLARSEGFKNAPPPADWDGVYRLTTK